MKNVPILGWNPSTPPLLQPFKKKKKLSIDIYETISTIIYESISTIVI